MPLNLGARLKHYGHSTFLITTEDGVNVEVVEVAPGGSVD